MTLQLWLIRVARRKMALQLRDNQTRSDVAFAMYMNAGIVQTNRVDDQINEDHQLMNPWKRKSWLILPR